MARAGEGPSGARAGAGGLGPRHSACFQLPGSARPLGLCPTFCAVSNDSAPEKGLRRGVSRLARRVSGGRLPERLGVSQCAARQGAGQWAGEGAGLNERGGTLGGDSGAGLRVAVGKGLGKARGGATR